MYETDILQVVQTQFPEYYQMELVQSGDFEKYYWQLVEKSNVWLRGDNVFIMQKYDFNKHRFIPGKYFHIRKWMSRNVCICNDYRNSDTCVHQLIVQIADGIEVQSINLKPFV
eukprot:412526_1